MTSACRRSRQAEALHACGTVPSLLAEQFGVTPDPELIELERRARIQEPDLDWQPSVARVRSLGRNLPAVQMPEDRRSMTARPSGTVTFMFTDIERSTELWNTYPDAMRVALARHEEIVQTAIVEHAGFIFAPTGDGVGAAFWRSADAIGAAVDAQRSLQAEPWPDPIAIRVRMGLHTGEAEERDGNYFGPPVNQAARVTNAANGGEILVSSTTVEVFGSTRDVELIDTGDHQLKGFAEPVQLYGVRADGLDATYQERAAVAQVRGRVQDRAAKHHMPLPDLLRLAPELPFVPRPDDWAAFEAAWTDTASGGRRLVLVAGEAGIGKTRLVTEFARSVYDRGATPLYGACADEVGLPYQPFVEALGHLLARADEPLRTAITGAAPDLAWLVPEAFGRDAPPPTEEEPEVARHRLYSAVTTALALAARQWPILLVLDDLHWAGHPTIHLLEHLSRAASLPGVCVVAVYRAAAGEIGEPLKVALPDLRRRPGTTSIVVGAFDRADVGQFVAVAAGHDVDARLDPLIEMLASQTAGNPFLLGELWHDLNDTGRVSRVAGRCEVTGPLDDIHSPDTVRDVVRGRLRRLPPETRAVLQTAAVMGTAFPPSVLAAAIHLDVRTTFVHLEPAFDTGIVEDSGPDECRFTHALVRQSVYDDLTPGQRRGRHLDVARALESALGERAAAQIAHHYVAAIPVADLGMAITAARRAAAAAMAAVAYDNAAAHLEAVIALAPDSIDRCRLLIEAADAHMRAGDISTAQARAVEAAALARRLDVPELIVAAAVAYEDACWRGGLPGAAAEKLLREALALAADEATRVRLQSSLSAALAFAGRAEEAHATADDAVARARLLDDRRALLASLLALACAPWSPATLARQTDANRELLALSRSQHAHEAELQALPWLAFNLLVSGEFDEFRRTMTAYHDRVDESAQPHFRFYLLQTESAVALAEGRFHEAERLAVEASNLGPLLSAMDLSGGFGVQMFSIRREQGRLDEVRPVVETIARLGQESATWKSALALLYTELRMSDAARLLRELVADDFRAIPRDGLWCGSLTYLADAAIAAGDRQAAEAIYAALQPFAGLVVPVGWCVAFQGPADRFLGSLADLVGRRTAASVHFEVALELATRSRMAVWLARTQVAYARFLVRTLAAPDRARPLLEAARSTAAALALGPVQRELDSF